MLKRSAHQNPSTENPVTRLSASNINNAFMTRVNNPSVITVIGSVRIRSKGLIRAFIIPNTKAVTRAVVKLSTWTPGSKYDALKITSAERSHPAIIFIK